MNRLLCTLLLACGVQASAESQLRDISEGARYASGCDMMVTMNLSPSFPVPVRTQNGLRYRLVFYPTHPSNPGSDDEILAVGPTVVAEFDMSGKVDCTRPKGLPGGSGKPLGPANSAAAKGMTLDEYEGHEKRLYSNLEITGTAFQSRKVSPASRQAAQEYLALFRRFSEPGLQVVYRALSPEFWAWIEGLEKSPSKKKL